MRMILRWSVLAFAAAVALEARPADACTCGRSTCGDLAKADAVFEATVESIELSTAPPPAGTTVPAGAVYVGGDRRIVKLKDIKAYRGQPQATIVTGMGAGDCGYSFKAGTRYLIDAYRLKDGRLSTGICGGTRAIEGNEGVLDYLKSLSGPLTQTRVWGQVLTFSAWKTFEPETAPVANKLVTISGPTPLTLTTDAQGRFAATNLLPGTYKVTADIRPSAWPSEIDFTFAPNDPYACAEVMFIEAPSGRITGTIVDDKGKPLSGVFVQLKFPNQADRTTRGWAGAGSVTGEQGIFEFDNLPPGDYLVGLGIGSGPATYARTPSGNTTIALTAGQSVTLLPLIPRRLDMVSVTGTVRDAKGEPAEGVEIHPLGFNADGTQYGTMPVKTDKLGRFTASLVRGERYTIAIGPRNFPQAWIEFAAGDQPLSLTLAPR